MRLGLDEREEILPSFKEARMKVIEHQEKRQFFEGMQKQQEIQQEAMAQQQQIQKTLFNLHNLPKGELTSLIKEGQRFGGQPWKQRWWNYCDQGWFGIYDFEPAEGMAMMPPPMPVPEGAKGGKGPMDM